MKRICKKCLQILPIDYFTRTGKNHIWRRHICKICINKSIRTFYFKHRELRNKSIEKYEKSHPWFLNFSAIKGRCEYNPKQNYYKKGIKCKITLNQIKELWFRDKAYLMEKPCISRNNHNKDYIFSNCKFEESSIHSRNSALNQWKKWRKTHFA